MSVSLHATITRSINCLSTDLGSDMVLMSIDRGIYMALNGMGRDIWMRLSHPCSVNQLCRDLADEYNTSPDVIIADVTGFLETLAKADMVDVAGN